MKFSVIICTYNRHVALKRLLETLSYQSSNPVEIIVVDSSEGRDSEDIMHAFEKTLPIKYIHADRQHRGLTRQRNLGVLNTSRDSDVIIFLDDDLVPEDDFFEQLILPFSDREIIGSDGLITNENYWQPIPAISRSTLLRQVFDGYDLRLAMRDSLRAILGLYPFKYAPGVIPPYGHGKSSLPPTGKTYEVDHIMGGMTAYRRTLFDHISFATTFEGYGLYEDYDFSIRASRFGKLITNTAARTAHYHASSGRPNQFKYGLMVVRNGWYVWRLKHPRPGIWNIGKWHMITLLLMTIRLFGVFTTTGAKRTASFSDGIGRFVGWLWLCVSKPDIR